MGTHARCSATVYERGRGAFGGSPCSHRATSVEDGKPVCGVHSKAAEAKRRARSDAHYAEKRREWDARFAREDACRDVVDLARKLVRDGYTDAIRESMKRALDVIDWSTRP